FLESIRPTTARAVLSLVAFLAAGMVMRGQAPTPSTSGIPTGVARIPPTSDNKATPNPKEAPPVWSGPGADPAVVGAGNSVSVPIAAPIAPGDIVDVGEFHTPEFHSVVRVSSAGTVMLPMIDEVRIEGMNEFE